ncbi:MAG: hypothetical protein PHW34_09220 [Hespellia sp.]|nr:hypothetical protein [Hespellia sp.]
MNTLQDVTNMFLGYTGSRPMTAETAGRMKKYELAYEKDEYLMLSFSRVDATTGDLSLVDDDITVLMPADQISGKPYDLRYRAQKLDDVYCVKVTRIDPDRKIVYVSHQEARLEKRPEIEAALEMYLASKAKNKSPMIVKGKVLKIQTKMVNGESVDTGVWLDLCGVGIPAFIYVGNWKKTFTESLRGKVSYGDIVEVVVLEKVMRKDQMYYYSCSRKELVQDPWESMELGEKYHKGDIVKIKCLSKRDTHWFGEINGLEDIQVFAEYPSQKHDFAIVPGMEYMGTIYYVNPEEHSLKARVFQALTFEQIEEKNVVVEENSENKEQVDSATPEIEEQTAEEAEQTEVEEL